MNILPVVSCILLLAVGAAAVGAEPATSATKPAADDGVIELFDKNNNSDCQFAFVTGQHRLQQGNECRNDELGGFMLHNVESAATFIMTDAGDCGDDENFYFEFKTIKHDTTTAIVNLDTIPTFEEGAVVTPGLRLIKMMWDGGTIAGKLSCLKIIRSQ